MLTKEQFHAIFLPNSPAIKASITLYNFVHSQPKVHYFNLYKNQALDSNYPLTLGIVRYSVPYYVRRQIRQHFWIYSINGRIYKGVISKACVLSRLRATIVTDPKKAPAL